MNKLMVYSALAVALMAGEPCLVPIYAQDKAVQAMTLTALYNLADQQSQKVRVSEVALQAASEGVAAAKWRGSDLYRYKIPPKKPKINPVYPPLQRTTVTFVTKDIPPIMQIKNPARRPIVVQPISETARKAAEACEFFTCLLIEFHNV